MANYDALLQPIQLKNLTIRNRIMSTSHAPAYAEDGMPKERYQLYHEEKAKGGIGLTLIGGSSPVSADCPATFGQLDASTDRIVPYFQEFAERIHKHGAHIICQITHTGRRTHWSGGDWLPPISSSPVREPQHRSFPKAMEDWDFPRVIRDFGQAARRCKDGGMDGVELIFGAHHLVDQFWSPSINRRTDKYGGSLENRMRFGFEVLEEIRKQVGDDYVVGIRMSGDEMIDDGLNPQQCLEIAKAHARSGLIDYLNIFHSNASTHMSLTPIMPNMAYPVAPFLYLASGVKAEVDIPVIHAGRITDIATAARAVEDGHVDMVGMTRAHMADPHLVKKLMEGRGEDIRECVGANYCIDRIYMGAPALCLHNPATGREATMPHIVPKAEKGGRKIVVVGAGPAGLEAARVSAERGHRVVLFEAAERTGGQINLAAKATWREGLAGIVRWLDAQVGKLGVEVRLNTEASADMVKAENPEIVVVATGGRPNKGRFKGDALAVGSWDILSSKVAPGDSVLMYDDNGQHQGPSCAEFMAKRGAKVELVTPDRMTAEEMGCTNFAVHLRELHTLDVIMTPDLRLKEVYAEGNRMVAVLRNEYNNAEEERVIDQVVAEHGTLPADDLYFALKPDSINLGELDIRAFIDGRPQEISNNPGGAFMLFRIGDAVASRNVHAAIFDGLRLCKEF